MTDLDGLTKDELLAHAKEIGASPANAAMSKDELKESIRATEGEAEVEGQAEVEELVTTTMTKDYLARPLVNPTPGVSNATDHLGRAVQAGNLDYIGRALVA